MILLTSLIAMHLLLKLRTTTKYSHKYISDYLPNESGCTIFVQPPGKEEIANISIVFKKDSKFRL